MKKDDFSKKDLNELIDISKNVIAELQHFYGNYEVNSNAMEDIPLGMDDMQADLITKQIKSTSVVQDMNELLAEEPFIGWVKTLRGELEEIFLICRNYTPELTAFGENSFFANKFAEIGYFASTTKVNSEFKYGNSTYKVIKRDRYLKPKRLPEPDGINNTIDLASGTYTIDSLRKLLSYGIIDPTKEISDILKKAIENNEITRGLKRRILESIELRDQPILDEIQTVIYRTPIQTNLIITGAPGTGKTTVLINRISLSTKPHHLSDGEKTGLSVYALRLIAETPSNWVLYTPTELLNKYLQQAFNKENIPAHDKLIKIWHTERMDLGKNVLKFLKVVDKGLFVMRHNQLLKISKNNELEKYTNKFIEYINLDIIEKLKFSVNELNNLYPENKLSKEFENALKLFESEIENITSDLVFRILDRFSTIRNIFNESQKAYEQKLNELTEQAIKNDNHLLENIIVNSKNINNEDNDEFDEDDDMLETDEIEVRDEDSSKTLKIEAYRKLKKAISLKAERSFKKQSISQKHSLTPITSLINEFAEQNREKYLELGKLRAILKLTNVLTSGIARNLIQSVPSYYNKFRTGIIKNSDNIYFNEEHTEDILVKKHISLNEIDIIIFIMLRNANRYFMRNQNELRNETNSELLQNIKSKYLNIVTVDEATDFPSVTLGCMYYLSHPFIRSVTLTGDPMQRVTNDGINDWKDCNFIVDKWQLSNLHMVYRQSPKLLRIAWELYNKFIGPPPFTTAFAEHSKDPDPLRFHSDNDDSFKAWITNRILEVYKITEGKASIALFVSNDSEIDALYDLISEPLSENNIEVDKCEKGRILGTDSKVRIFSIEYIKGLEFESVFLINIDQIYEKQPELVDKYLYVGLTRAGSFLAVTYNNEFPEPLQFIKEHFKESNWSHLS